MALKRPRGPTGTLLVLEHIDYRTDVSLPFLYRALMR